MQVFHNAEARAVLLSHTCTCVITHLLGLVATLRGGLTHRKYQLHEGQELALGRAQGRSQPVLGITPAPCLPSL
jgi:hypothetical protein